MARILDLINRACTRCKMNSISKIAGSKDLQAAEFLEYANQSAKFIADFWDWRKLTKEWHLNRIEVDNYQYEEDRSGTKCKYALPEDYDSLITRNIYDFSRDEVLSNQTDDASLRDRAAKTNTSAPSWRIVGEEIVFSSPVEMERDLVLTYKTKNFVKGADGKGKTIFTADDDTFLLDEEALILGIMWQKSLGYEDTDLQARQEQFMGYLEYLKGKDNAKRVTSAFGRDNNRISPTSYQEY